MWMEYEEFAEAVKKRMEQEVGEGGSVSFCDMEKINQARWEGLEIKEEGQQAGAVFRLKGLYAAYQKGGMEHTVSFIREMMEKKPDPASWDIPGEWEEARECVRLVLLNAEWNRELLEGCPSREFLDLAAAYCLELGDKDYRATALVKEYYLESWGVTEGELWETALENLRKEEYGIKPLSEILESMLGPRMGSFHDFPFLYVLTNQRVSHGAAGILRKDLLEEFSKLARGNFYILPSSVHETLLLGDGPGIKAEDLRDMVQSINRDEVSQEEWLSNNVYYYDREKGELEIAL